MDMSGNDKLEPEKRDEETLNYNHHGLPGSDWRYNGASFVNSSMGLVSNGNAMAVCGEGVGPSCSSGAMVDSYGPAGWEHSVNPASLGFNEMNVHNGAAGAPDPLSMLKGGMLLPNMSGMLPHSLSQFPADSAFIERAARFSSFSGGHFGELLNPFGMQQQPVNPYLRGGMVMQGLQEGLSGDAMKTLPVRQPQKNDANVIESSKDVSVPPESEVGEGGSSRNDTVLDRSHTDTKQGVSMSGNDSDEPEFSGGGTQEGGTPLSAKGLSAKKRKRGNQEAEIEQTNGDQPRSGEVGKKNSGSQQKGEQNPTTGNKSNGKHGKQNSQNSDPPKDEYIHVRARRGQATNSHSLAERVRREKISERMKFLQDLVPGCSKVTGKAVMLDEIINYVQSLQRQVEFLSMKLSTVNPRLDFNIERLLAKDHMFSARAGPSGLGISPDMPMTYPSLHPSQPSILQSGLPGIGNCSDVLRRTNSQLTNMGGYKEPNSQLPNAWEDELHNVVQMGFNATAPLDNQETNCSAPEGQMKAEP